MLGDRTYFTPWSVTNIEMSIASQEVVTLRSRATFGALPRLLLESIPQEGRIEIRQFFEQLTNEIYRAGPQSIIDRSRDLTSSVLRVYLRSKNVPFKANADLFALVEELGKAAPGIKKEIALHASQIVRIFHSCGKPGVNEVRPDTRGIHEQDAELAVLCVGTILCDLGWAVWNTDAALRTGITLDDSPKHPKEDTG